jgi:signal transduction histidine kinase/CheY-like chemotaxis protein/HPt (histidine-containing phosphotransfer) domain-containing protein
MIMMNKNLPIPKNEVSRLDALAQYNILDTLPEEEFDRLTQLASIICGVPIALISLIDKDRQWFKSKIGLNAPETPRDVSFCQYTINGESLLEIEDATKDERFLSNPLVTDQPNIRFYAGHPLIDPDGYALGSLCVIDFEARTLTSDQKLSLTLLANEVVSKIVSRKKNAEKENLAAELVIANKELASQNDKKENRVAELVIANKELGKEKIKAEAASKAKESFLTNMSHEIRTPLNAIIGFLRELEKQELSDLQKTYIDNSSIASKHLLAILNNILDLSKIEAGEMSLENEDFIIEDTINNVVKVLQSTAKEKGIKLSALILDKVNKVFKGDSLRIEEILFNLVGNALKFTKKGKIDVSCELLSDNNISQIIRISVADTGIGMEQKYTESIFEKFSQEDKSITRKYGGTGLGMAITEELVHLMGGEIESESEKNKGTTIHVKINLIKGNIESVKKLQAKVDFNLKGLSILLVEDIEMNRMVIQNALHYFNCNVTESENGLEAVEILKTQNFDLILMDIQMPEMDGIEATKVIRKELKLSTPIIALTANAFKTEIEKCKQAGMNDYVVKPFKETVLLQTIVKHTINKNGIPSLDNEVNPNQPLYNLSVLHNSSRGNDKFVLKMVGIFVEQTIATIEKIDAALESNNFLEISQLIHKIKPSIDSMGVLSIQSEMKTLEKIAKETQNKGQITAIYTLVKKTLQLVISQLQKKELNA